MMIDVADITDDLLQRLAPLRTSLSLRDLSFYHGQFSEERSRVLGLCPFIWVAYVGSPSFEIVNLRMAETMEFEIWLGDRDYSGRAGMAHHGGPGAFALLHGVRKLLVGCSPLGGGVLLPHRIDALSYHGASLYRVRLRTEQNQKM